MLAELAEKLIRFHMAGSEETIQHIITTLRLAEVGMTARLAVSPQVDEMAERANRKRKYDRERLRTLRGTHGDDATESHDNQEESHDFNDTVSPKKIPPYNPLKKLPLPETKKTAAPLPIGWKPNDDHLRLANELRLGAVGMAYEAARMADWAAKDGKCCIDWDAQFRSWLRVGKPKDFIQHGTTTRSKISNIGDKVVGPTYFIKVGTPQWDAWVANGHKKGMRTYRNGDPGWTFETEWPNKSCAASA